MQIESANPRGCYCQLWQSDPEGMRAQKYAEGYCGVCERCGKPGHTRHHPANFPVTSAWCDRCYKIVYFTRFRYSLYFWAGLLTILFTVTKEFWSR
jgi:hypothetical protein